MVIVAGQGSCELSRVGDLSRRVMANLLWKCPRASPTLTVINNNAIECDSLRWPRLLSGTALAVNRVLMFRELLPSRTPVSPPFLRDFISSLGHTPIYNLLIIGAKPAFVYSRGEMLL